MGAGLLRAFAGFMESVVYVMENQTPARRCHRPGIKEDNQYF